MIVPLPEVTVSASCILSHITMNEMKPMKKIEGGSDLLTSFMLLYENRLIKQDLCIITGGK